jgi:hypothetical protein
MNNWPPCQDLESACLVVNLPKQLLYVLYQNQIHEQFSISSAKNGPGELENSECTPRGWHEIAEIYGKELKKNAVFVGREWTGEIYSNLLAEQFPHRDWILSRILRLRGLEPGFNLGGKVDSYSRYIYIHGTPDSEPMGLPLSHGCIRMRNIDVIKLSDWVKLGVKVFIDANGIFDENHSEQFELIGVLNNE